MFELLIRQSSGECDKVTLVLFGTVFFQDFFAGFFDRDRSFPPIEEVQLFFDLLISGRLDNFGLPFGFELSRPPAQQSFDKEDADKGQDDRNQSKEQNTRNANVFVTRFTTMAMIAGIAIACVCVGC